MVMVAHAEMNNLSFVYADENEYALQHISLSIQKESLLYLPAIRVRKTTLLKHFKRNYFQLVSVLGIHIMMVLY